MIVLFPTEVILFLSIVRECSRLFTVIYDGIIPVSLSVTFITNALFMHHSNGTIEMLFWFRFAPISIGIKFSITNSGNLNEQLPDSVKYLDQKHEPISTKL